MDRNKILREILDDKELCEKYDIKNTDNLTTNAPYFNKLVEVLSILINENANNLTESHIYRKVKSTLNIG